MKTKLVVSLAAVLISAALPMLAHHSFAAEFDDSKEGGVERRRRQGGVDVNPHIWLYVDAKDDSGKMVRWQCEGGPPNTLTRNGWTKGCAEGRRSDCDRRFSLQKDGSNTCNARSVTLPSGQKVFAGSAETPKGAE